MTELHLPGLIGAQAHGWFPTIGLARLLALDWPDATLTWGDDLSPIIRGGPITIEAAADTVRAHSLDLTPAGGCLPEVDKTWPTTQPPGDPALARQVWTGEQGTMWHRTLISPCGDLHPLIRPHAAQTLRSMTAKPGAVLRRAPRLLGEALGPRVGITDSYPGGLWLLRTSDPADPQLGAAASPGRDWLTLMGMPWHPVSEYTADGGLPVVSAPGWRHGQPRGGGPIYTWSLWTDAVPLGAVPERLQALDEQPEEGMFVARRRRRTQPYDPPMLVAGPTERRTARPHGQADHLTLPVDRGTMRRLHDVATRLGQPPAEVAAALLDGAIIGADLDNYEPDPAERLRWYARLRAGLHDDIRSVHAELGNASEVARLSGLSRQGIIKILERNP